MSFFFLFIPSNVGQADHWFRLRYEPTTIYYTWQRVTPSLSIPTTPQELTRFIPPGSTYKPLDVPLPKNVQVGESWRLGLFSQNDNPQNSNGLLNGGEREGKLRSTNELLDLVDDAPDVLGDRKSVV